MYKNAPVLYKSSQEIRNLIIEWGKEHRVIPARPSNNWRLLPFDEKKIEDEDRGWSMASM